MPGKLAASVGVPAAPLAAEVPSANTVPEGKHGAAEVNDIDQRPAWDETIAGFFAIFHYDPLRPVHEWIR